MVRHAIAGLQQDILAYLSVEPYLSDVLLVLPTDVPADTEPLLPGHIAILDTAPSNVLCAQYSVRQLGYFSKNSFRERV